MNHQELYKLLLTVQKNVKCPQCGKGYDLSLIEIRGIVDSIVFLELSCKGHMPLLATVSLSKKPQETKREKVTSDDLIEIHKKLNNFNGDFEKLFKINNKDKESNKK